MMAEIDDIPDITHLYLELLGLKGQDFYKTKDVLRDFLYEHINREVFVSCIYIDNSIVSTAMLVKHVVCLDVHSLNECGHYGVIKNLYTAHDYRNRRFATGCINELVRFAQDNRFIRLCAPIDIKNICERAGFTPDIGSNMMHKNIK